MEDNYILSILIQKHFALFVNITVNCNSVAIHENMLLKGERPSNVHGGSVYGT